MQSSMRLCDIAPAKIFKIFGPPNIPSHAPRASLTNVVALNGGPGSPEAQTDVLDPSPAALSSPLGLAALLLVVLENVRLLLESALALDSQFGGHDCCVLGNRSKLATMVYFSEVVVEVAVGRASNVQSTIERIHEAELVRLAQCHGATGAPVTLKCKWICLQIQEWVETLLFDNLIQQA